MSRVLELEDHDELEALMRSRDTFLGVHADALEIHREASVATAKDLLRIGHHKGRIYGKFFDGKLELEAAVFTVISGAHPCYYINKAYTHPESSKAALSTVFQDLIVDYEKLGYQRFYTMYRKEDIATYHKLWRTSKVLRNYISYTDLEVKPNVRPKHSDYWELMFGRMLYTSTMVIRGFVLKTETMFYNEP